MKNLFLSILFVLTLLPACKTKASQDKTHPQASDCYAAGPCAFEQAGATCEYLSKSYTCKACIWLATDAVSKYPDGSIFTNPSCKPSN